MLDKDGRTLLYRTALPPDLGPLLAAGILSELRQRRQRGTDYPTTAAELARTVRPSASADAVVKALADRSIKGQVVAAARDREAPVVLKEDGALLAASSRLIEFALERARSDFDQAVNAANLKRKVPKELQADFAASLDRTLGADTLPAGIGALRVKKAWHLFFLRDVQGATAAPAPAPQPSALAPLEFAVAFEAAFARRDRECGSNNFVSLVDLRRDLPVDRDTFDRELRRLRQAGRFTLSAAEGRHGLSPEEQDAAIREEGTLLLFVARKAPG
jgi:hypothetical protein